VNERKGRFTTPDYGYTEGPFQDAQIRVTTSHHHDAIAKSETRVKIAIKPKD
jgi:hypothetical protein